MNVEYVEQRDEFDVDGTYGKLPYRWDTGNQSSDSENAPVDVFTIDPVPVLHPTRREEERFHVRD
jgi:hypothetical protein